MIDEIVKLYYEPIYVYCRSALNGDKAAAEDVTQEVFLALFKKVNRLKLGVNIKHWLYRAADLEIKVYIRKHPSHISIDDIPEEDLLSEDCYPSETENLSDYLNDDEAALIREYYNADSKEAVAEKHGIGISVLQMRIYRIKKKLSAKLEKRYKINQ